MLEYIKMIIIALFSGVMMPLPVSSAAHYSLLTKIMSCSENERELSFYYWVFALTFSLVVFIFLRKIYFKSIKALFTFKKQELEAKKLTPYKKVIKNIFLGMLPMALLFLPITKDRRAIDYFSIFLKEKGFLLTATACVINAVVLLIALWYAKKGSTNKNELSTRDTMRMSVYHLISFVVPGFSHVGGSAANLFLCDLQPRIVMRDVYLYVAPQMFVVSVLQIIRYIINDLVIDPILVAIAAGVSGAVAALVVSFAGKFSIKRLLGFFSVYSILLGVALSLCIFVI